MPEPDVNDRIGDFRNKNGVEDGFFRVAELHDATWWTNSAEGARNEALGPCFGSGIDYWVGESRRWFKWIKEGIAWEEERGDVYLDSSGLGVRMHQ